MVLLHPAVLSVVLVLTNASVALKSSSQDPPHSMMHPFVVVLNVIASLHFALPDPHRDRIIAALHLAAA
eukprot:NODE_22220_length_717_cov_3.991525.p3 GENE.NODE_22220_length_717_cov_3.991525~~NODE_22220_length_717_cov_3.991525.p3  ORF type:complete len:69 (+),score=14.62 NODE_22220_length_717_cov_3.991525:114-320(+)